MVRFRRRVILRTLVLVVLVMVVVGVGVLRVMVVGGQQGVLHRRLLVVLDWDRRRGRTRFVTMVGGWDRGQLGDFRRVVVGAGWARCSRLVL